MWAVGLDGHLSQSVRLVEKSVAAPLKHVVTSRWTFSNVRKTK